VGAMRCHGADYRFVGDQCHGTWTPDPFSHDTERVRYESKRYGTERTQYRDERYEYPTGQWSAQRGVGAVLGLVASLPGGVVSPATNAKAKAVLFLAQHINSRALGPVHSARIVHATSYSSHSYLSKT
jgi:hypothetical protein